MADPTPYNRLYGLLGKLKPRPSDTHPVWHASGEYMGQYISQRLRIHTALGQPIDHAYVDRLESFMPKPKARLDRTPKRMWINQPSTQQPLHARHGERVLAARESARVCRVWPLDGPIVSEQMLSVCLSEGWPA